MARTDFGHCIGCDRPIPPPYLQLKVMRLEQERGDDARITEWDEIDICEDCAGKLTADDVHRLASTEDTESRQDAGDRRRGYASSSPPSSTERARG